MYTFFRVSPHHDFLLCHLLFHLLFFSLFFSSLLSSFLRFSLLSSIFSFLSSLFSLCLLSLSLSPCVGGVCVSSCVFVWSCVVWCGVVCAVWCGTLKTPCIDSKRFPCVDSKRPRVYRHHAHMLKSMWAWCQYTRRRSESTHGKRFESTHGGHRQFCIPKFAHVWLSRASEVHQKNF